MAVYGLLVRLCFLALALWQCQVRASEPRLKLDDFAVSAQINASVALAGSRVDIDIGRQIAGAKVRLAMAITNQTETDWDVIDVKTDCGCVIVEDFTGVVKSGDQVTINADISISYQGKLARQLILRGRDKQGNLQELAYLIVTAVIHQPVLVKPAEIDFRHQDINESFLVECKSNLDGLNLENASAIITGRWVDEAKVVSQTAEKIVFEVKFNIVKSDHSEHETAEGILLVRPDPQREESRKFHVPIELKRRRPLTATPSVLLIDDQTTKIKMVIRGDFTKAKDDNATHLKFLSKEQTLLEADIEMQQMSSAFSVLRWQPSEQQLEKLFSAGSGEMEITIQQQTIVAEFIASQSSDRRVN